MTSPWPGTDPRDALELAQTIERREVLLHVAAALRVHHRRRAVEHVIAGEQRAFFVEPEAQMVRRVARRVQRFESELRAVDRVAVAEHPIERDRDFVGLRKREEPGELGARLLRELGRGGPMVGVRVREQHPAHALAHRRADDRVDVLGEIGTGIDHRDLVDADEIRVRSGSGHQARDCSRRRVARAATARSAHRESGRARRLAEFGYQRVDAIERASASRLRCVGRMRSTSPRGNGREFRRAASTPTRPTRCRRARRRGHRARVPRRTACRSGGARLRE